MRRQGAKPAEHTTTVSGAGHISLITVDELFTVPARTYTFNAGEIQAHNFRNIFFFI